MNLSRVACDPDLVGAKNKGHHSLTDAPHLHPSSSLPSLYTIPCSSISLNLSAHPHPLPTSQAMRLPTYPVKSRPRRPRQRLRVIRADRRRTGLLRVKVQTNVRKQPTRRTRRGPIPDQMSGWYKKSLSGEKSKPPEPPDSSAHPDHSVNEQSKTVDTGDVPNSPQGHHDLPQPLSANSAYKPPNDLDSDSDPDQPEPVQPNVRNPVSRPEEDSDSGSEGERTESEDEEEPGNGDNLPGETVTPEEPETSGPEPADDANNMEVDIVPIFPASAVAASSIMASNTVIETPSPPSSASTSISPSPAPATPEKTKCAATPGTDALKDVCTLRPPLQEARVSHNLRRSLPPAETKGLVRPTSVPPGTASPFPRPRSLPGLSHTTTVPTNPSPPSIWVRLPFERPM